MEVPYNATIKKEKSKLEGIRRDASNLVLLIYQAIRRDVMAYTVPCSLTLEKVSLLMPEAITTLETAIKTISKLVTVITEENVQALLRADLFPTMNNVILPHLITDENAPVPIDMQLRNTDRNNDREVPITFHSYTMRGGDLNHCLQVSCKAIKSNLRSLEECLKERLENITTDPLYTSVAILLDSKSYATKSVDDMKRAANVVWERFKDVLEANGCDDNRLGINIIFFL